MPLVALVGLLLAVEGVAAASPPPHHDHHAYRGWAGAPALTIPPGTDIPVALDVNVTLQRDQVGNAFPAHLTRDVVVDGAVAIPAGAPAEVALVESEYPGRRVVPSAAGIDRWTDAARADRCCPWGRDQVRVEHGPEDGHRSIGRRGSRARTRRR